MKNSDGMSGCDPEEYLSSRDQTLRKVIMRNGSRWSFIRPSYPIWQLLRIVMAQQISTTAAMAIALRVARIYPELCGEEIPCVKLVLSRLQNCGHQEDDATARVNPGKFRKHSGRKKSREGISPVKCSIANQFVELV